MFATSCNRMTTHTFAVGRYVITLITQKEVCFIKQVSYNEAQTTQLHYLVNLTFQQFPNQVQL